jgi:hypothetical protein
MLCTNCGEATSPATKFCSACGRATATLEEPPPTSRDLPHQVMKEEEDNANPEVVEWTAFGGKVFHIVASLGIFVMVVYFLAYGATGFGFIFAAFVLATLPFSIWNVRLSRSEIRVRADLFAKSYMLAEIQHVYLFFGRSRDDLLLMLTSGANIYLRGVSRDFSQALVDRAPNANVSSTSDKFDIYIDLVTVLLTVILIQLGNAFFDRIFHKWFDYALGIVAMGPYLAWQHMSPRIKMKLASRIR